MPQTPEQKAAEKAAAEETKRIAAEQKAAEKAAGRAGTTSVSVFGPDGNFIRSYTAERHGEAFISLAEGFAEKKGGTVRKS
jgi:sarcosine oxidase gamma subunit